MLVTLCSILTLASKFTVVGLITRYENPASSAPMTLAR
jgi:hypothetical protein